MNMEIYISENEAICLICKTFQNHQSIKESKKSLRGSAQTKQNKTNKFVSSEHVEKILRNIDQKKSSGTDKNPHKLVQVSAEILSTQLTDAMNNSIYQRENS